MYGLTRVENLRIRRRLEFSLVLAVFLHMLLLVMAFETEFSDRVTNVFTGGHEVADRRLPAEKPSLVVSLGHHPRGQQDFSGRSRRSCHSRNHHLSLWSAANRNRFLTAACRPCRRPPPRTLRRQSHRASLRGPRWTSRHRVSAASRRNSAVVNRSRNRVRRHRWPAPSTRSQTRPCRQVPQRRPAPYRVKRPRRISVRVRLLSRNQRPSRHVLAPTSHAGPRDLHRHRSPVRRRAPRAADRPADRGAPKRSRRCPSRHGQPADG